ncbi:hypothetical protein K2173_005743 [Erythroxylum novogranatense]|uniref:Uncharacterized protein n=1 Tax=Erythroxylum novogranatense TaxID=1862640 RepID=A0AAV8U2H6_9ROSI|nr:hypothetical protein K2173_005743 [Erythroxylum novogranatense]
MAPQQSEPKPASTGSYKLRCGRLSASTFVADHPFIFTIKEEASSLHAYSSLYVSDLCAASFPLFL